MDEDRMLTVNEMDETSLVFHYTSNLQRQDIPRNVTCIRVDAQTLPVWALNKLTSLEHVEFPNGFQVIGSNALFGCISLKMLNLPPSAKEIRAGALSGCFQLSRVHLNNGLHSILDGAFQHCRSLVNIGIPPSITTLGNLVFHGCHSLCWVELPYGLQFLGRSVFLQCNNLERIHLPATIAYIGAYCFKDCFRLQSVELAPQLQMIRAEAFRNCPNLRNICISAETALEGGYDNVFDPDILILSVHGELGDLDVQVDMEFFEGMHTDDGLNSAIHNRYEKLPVHRLCYFQGHWSSMNDLGEGRKDIVEEMNHQLLQWRQNGTDNQDHVCLTPLHILAMSAKPNAKLWKLVHQACPWDLFLKDKFGKEPLQYLLECSVEENVEIVTIMKHAIPARLNHRLEFLGDQWRAEFLEWIQELPMGTKASRCSSVNSVLEKRCHYERMEALSLLELAVWKAALQRTMRLSEEEKTFAEAEETDVSLESLNVPDAFIMDGNLCSEAAREVCRVQCGSDVVISHVVQFLDPPLKFYLMDPIALF